jgi:hypothetical protein
MSTIYTKLGAGWNGINTDDYFKNYFKDRVQKEKNYNTTTV